MVFGMFVDVLIVPALLIAAASASPPSPGHGISESLANDRAGAIQSLSYDLSFRIPPQRAEPIHAAEVVGFKLPAPRRIVLDFETPRDHVLGVRIAGRPSISLSSTVT